MNGTPRERPFLEVSRSSDRTARVFANCSARYIYWHGVGVGGHHNLYFRQGRLSTTDVKSFLHQLPRAIAISLACYELSWLFALPLMENLSFVRGIVVRSSGVLGLVSSNPNPDIVSTPIECSDSRPQDRLVIFTESLVLVFLSLMIINLQRQSSSAWVHLVVWCRLTADPFEFPVP